MRGVLPRILLVLAVLVPGTLLWGFGLGNITARSYIDEPFVAEIVMHQLGDLQEDNISVRLGTADEYSRLDIDYLDSHRDLSFRVDMDGELIHVTSTLPINEPFLDFVIVVNAAEGRLMRHYTVLLDLPIFESDMTDNSAPPGDWNRPPVAPVANNTRSAPAGDEPLPLPDVPAPAAPVAQAPPPRPVDVPLPLPPPDYSTAARAPAAAPVARIQPPRPAAGRDYRVLAGDTLWALADDHIEGTGLDIHRAMLAIVERNDAAFVDGDANRLRRGALLRMPAADVIARVNRAAALQHTRRAAERFAARARALAPGATPAVAQDSSSAAAAGAPAGRLRLTPAGDGGGTSQPLATTGGDDGEAEELRAALQQKQEQLDRMAEELDSNRLDSTQQQERIDSLEQENKTLERMIELQSEEWARAQAALSTPGGTVDAQSPSDELLSAGNQEGQDEQDDAPQTQQQEQQQAPPPASNPEPSMLDSVLDALGPLAKDAVNILGGLLATLGTMLSGVDWMALLGTTWFQALIAAVCVVGGVVVWMRKRSVDDEESWHDDGSIEMAPGVADGEELEGGIDMDATPVEDSEEARILEDAEAFVAAGEPLHAIGMLEAELEKNPQSQALQKRLDELRGGDQEAAAEDTGDDAGQPQEQQDQPQDEEQEQDEEQALTVPQAEDGKPEQDEEVVDDILQDMMDDLDLGGDEIMGDDAALQEVIDDAGGMTTTEDQEEQEHTINFDLGDTMAAPAEGDEEPDVGADTSLNFDEESIGAGGDAETPDEDDEEGMSAMEDLGELGGLDGLDDADASGTDDAAAVEPDAADDGAGMAIDAGDEIAPADAGPAADAMEFDEDQEAEMMAEPEPVERAGAAADGADAECDTKLELANAYIEMGDKENANLLLEEVLSDGTESQKERAQQMVDQIAGY